MESTDRNLRRRLTVWYIFIEERLRDSLVTALVLTLCAAKGGCVQCSGNTGTTSMWELSRREGEEGWRPGHVTTSTGREDVTHTTECSSPSSEAR